MLLLVLDQLALNPCAQSYIGNLDVGAFFLQECSGFCHVMGKNAYKVVGFYQGNLTDKDNMTGVNNLISLKLGVFSDVW